MQHTPNYDLSQWSADDRVLMDDFNTDNAKIDGAIAAVAAQKADAADLAALTALVGTPVKMAAGSYTGNGSSSRTINLGFTPRAVYLCTSFGITYGSYIGAQVYGGLAVTGSPLLFYRAGQTYTAMEIVSGGFRVVYNSMGDNYYIDTNDPKNTFHYIAFG